MKDEFEIRFSDKYDHEHLVLVYATSMYEAVEEIKAELGPALKSINEVVNTNLMKNRKKTD